MVINNIFATNATMMTLSERFTILQNVRPVSAPPRQRQTSKMYQDQNTRDRRLIERLALKPIAEAATALQRRPMKQRIGIVNKNTLPRKKYYNTKYKNMLNNKKTVMFRQQNNTYNNTRKHHQLRKQRNPPRNNAAGNSSQFNQRGNSHIKGPNNRGFRRGRGFVGKGQLMQMNSDNMTNFNNQRSNNFRRGMGNRRRGLVRGQTNVFNSGENYPINNTSNIGTRGRGRSQRRGINRSWFAQKTAPTKEELDKQLDLYMSEARSQLDRELDMYKSTGMDAD